MQSKLSDLVDNSLGINNMECKSNITIHGNLSLLDLKITDYIKNAKNAKKKNNKIKITKPINESIKNFEIIHKFCNVILTNFFCC